MIIPSQAPPNSGAEPVVVVHGGAGNSRRNEDGCSTACERGIAALGAEGSALDAAVRAVESLEDDGRFNAGSGSDLGLDGETLEMCASVMDTRGALGAVGVVRDVRNPIRLARVVATTPHWLVVSDGADRLARLAGLPRAKHRAEPAREANRKVVAQLQTATPALPGADNADFTRFWNYPMPWTEALRRFGCGTVGAVVRDRQGHFAVATSTGGAAPSLLGRMGDTPIVGCGFYCGPAGAVGATGIGEAIVGRLLALTVYGWLAEGRPLQEALEAGVALFDNDTDIGLIGVTAREHASASNRDMPTSSRCGA